MHKIFIAAMLLALIFLCACAPESAPSPEPAGLTETPVSAGHNPSGGVTVSFDYEKQSGSASNQFAVWVEDSAGSLVKTLYATKFTAKGGWQNRPDSIPLWVEKSGLAGMKKSGADAIAGATPKSGPVEYFWDLTDSRGDFAEPGEYHVIVEGSLRWKNYVLYDARVTLGGADGTLRPEPLFIWDNLTPDAPEAGMICNVTVKAETLYD